MSLVAVPALDEQLAEFYGKSTQKAATKEGCEAKIPSATGGTTGTASTAGLGLA